MYRDFVNHHNYRGGKVFCLVLVVLFRTTKEQKDTYVLSASCSKLQTEDTHRTQLKVTQVVRDSQGYPNKRHPRSPNQIKDIQGTQIEDIQGARTTGIIKRHKTPTTQVANHTCAPGGDNWADEEEDNQEEEEENEPSSEPPCARSPKC